MKSKHQESDRFFKKMSERKPMEGMNMFEMTGMMLTRISDQLEEIQASLHQIRQCIQDPSTPEQEQITASAPRKNWVSRLLN
ncbi:MAG TPA: hypothetical protein ENO27_02800 [Caldithrix sp.]|nr:hypothetical protein [Caldithrix sp.]